MSPRSYTESEDPTALRELVFLFDGPPQTVWLYTLCKTHVEQARKFEQARIYKMHEASVKETYVFRTPRNVQDGCPICVQLDLGAEKVTPIVRVPEKEK